MYSEGLRSLLLYVITSWQVITVTVGIIIYLNIVFFVARSYRTPRISSIKKQIRPKQKKTQAPSPDADGEDSQSLPRRSNNDELGLEED